MFAKTILKISEKVLGETFCRYLNLYYKLNIKTFCCENDNYVNGKFSCVSHFFVALDVFSKKRERIQQQCNNYVIKLLFIQVIMYVMNNLSSKTFNFSSFNPVKILSNDTKKIALFMQHTPLNAPF